MLKKSDRGFDFSKTARGDADPTEEDFGCNTYKGSPATPDRVPPDVVITRQVHNDTRLIAPDGKRLRCWGFSDPTSADPKDRAAPYPSPAMIVRQGQIVHSKINASKGPHTIHHHGIEPTTMNDGVGHVSFEVTGSYTYQWCPRHSGTFFYHCHRNTPLHFEMGMFGLLIVDPPEGPGVLYQNGPTYNAERELIWVLDDMDYDWHERIGSLGHEAGLCGENVGLHKFRPEYFLLAEMTGRKIESKKTSFSNATMKNNPGSLIAYVGERILLRITNASYSVLRITLGIEAKVHVVDGHELFRPWNKAYTIPANQPFEMTSAQRLDLIIEPTRKDTYQAKLEFLDWVTLTPQAGGKGIINTKIEVR